MAESTSRTTQGVVAVTGVVVVVVFVLMLCCHVSWGERVRGRSAVSSTSTVVGSSQEWWSRLMTVSRESYKKMTNGHTVIQCCLITNPKGFLGGGSSLQFYDLSSQLIDDLIPISHLLLELLES